jgi:methylamine dehydrogenase heavy chain
MRRRGTIMLALAGFATAAQAAAPGVPAPVLPVEESDTAVLAPAGPHRLYLFDAYGYAGATVIEGDDPAMKSMGLVPAARNGAMSLSRDASRIYVAETYWSRGDRGDRQDLLTVYDGATLAIAREIPLPGRLLVVPKAQQVATSDDGKLAYVYDMIPSSAIHVVDLDGGKLIGSVDIPGCALAFPYGPRSFATICGDGTIGTVAVAADGTGKASFTRPFFDPDQDPLFENSIVDRTTGEGWLLSFGGRIYPVKLGSTASVGQPWSLTVAAGLPAAGLGVQDLAWRPGGAQMLGVHRATKRLFVLMHTGNYWTHKADGTEVWVFDTDRHALIHRIRLDRPAAGIAVTQDPHPVLFAFAGDRGRNLAVYDATSGAKLREREASGFLGMVPGL